MANTQHFSEAIVTASATNLKHNLCLCLSLAHDISATDMCDVIMCWLKVFVLFKPKLPLLHSLCNYRNVEVQKECKSMAECNQVCFRSFDHIHSNRLTPHNVAIRKYLNRNHNYLPTAKNPVAFHSIHKLMWQRIFK